jgi:hypothetical protein
MRSEKALMTLLRGLVRLLDEESRRNPGFAARLDRLLSDRPETRTSAKRPAAARSRAELPDIHAEWSARGDADFRLWLREQPMQLLRALIRKNDLDPTRRTSRWKEVEKLSAFIADGLRLRLARGASFLGRGSGA